jgi:hypothetical protein
MIIWVKKEEIMVRVHPICWNRWIDKQGNEYKREEFEIVDEED